MKYQEKAPISANRPLQGDYYQIDLRAPKIAAAVRPGQFIHLRIPLFEHRVLRRPFSVYNTRIESGTLSVIYKVVGEGTAHLSGLPAGTLGDVMGPLGTGFSIPGPESAPIIVAGGYGCAATYLLAKRSARPCVCLIGGRSAGDLLLVDEFGATGARVAVSTEDGSLGHRGLVTDLLEAELGRDRRGARIYACGPNPMLKAVSDIAAALGIDAEISLDHVMCCGVGACLACVVKMKADTPQGWEYVRTCREGPVFQASRALWD